MATMKTNTSEIKGSRRLVLLDVENLAGSPLVTPRQAEQVHVELQQVCLLAPRDIVYVGGSPANAFACGLVATRTHGSMCLRRGPDGAEIALCERAKQVPHSAYESIRHPIIECVIGSGDHYFIRLAQQMRSRNVTVTVVSRRGSLSAELAGLADRVRYLDNKSVEIRKAA